MAKAQMRIAGTERQSIEAIDEAAAAYVEIRDKRMALGQQESELKKNLFEVVSEHRNSLPEVTRDGKLCRVYRYDGDEAEMEVVLKPGIEKLSVRRVKDDQEPAE